MIVSLRCLSFIPHGHQSPLFNIHSSWSSVSVVYHSFIMVVSLRYVTFIPHGRQSPILIIHSSWSSVLLLARLIEGLFLYVIPQVVQPVACCSVQHNQVSFTTVQRVTTRNLATPGNVANKTLPENVANWVDKFLGNLIPKNVAAPENVADIDPTGNVATSSENVAAVDPTGNVATSPENVAGIKVYV